MTEDSLSYHLVVEALVDGVVAETLAKPDGELVSEAKAVGEKPRALARYTRESLFYAAEKVQLNAAHWAVRGDRALHKASTSSAFALGEWLSEKLSKFSPRTLAWMATAAALAVVLQAGLLAGMFIQDHAGQGTKFASYVKGGGEVVRIGTGSHALIRFDPNLSVKDIPAFAQRYGITIVDGPTGPDLFIIRIGTIKMSTDETMATIKLMREDKRVIFVSPLAN